MSLFLEMGFSPAVVACSATPETDGYHSIRDGLPWHVHPEATPNEWAALAEAIVAGEVNPAPWSPPVISTGAALADLRDGRNALLAGCDWTQLPDSPLSDADRTLWAQYRQALRDLPETFAADPSTAVFPSAPGLGE